MRLAAGDVMRIDLLWFDGCPNHTQARALLEEVLAARGIAAEIHATEVRDPEAAEAVRFPGSPTIRVNGVDVEPGFEDPGEYALRCRVYTTPLSMSGVPPREWLERAIAAAMR